MANNNPAQLAHLRMPDYSGSWWEKNFSNTTTLRVGKWIPVTYLDIPGNSLFKMNPEIRFESLPMVSPLYNGFTMRTKYFFIPHRLYIPKLRKNLQLGWGDIPKEKLPRFKFQLSYIRSDNFERFIPISLAGSLFDRLNIAYGEFSTFQSFNKDFYNSPVPDNDDPDAQVQLISYANALPFLGYVDAWMRSEFNPQDKNIPTDYDILEFEGSEYYRIYGVQYFDFDKLQSFMDKIFYGDEYSGDSDVLYMSGNVLSMDFTGRTFDFVDNYSLLSSTNLVLNTNYTATAIKDNWRDLKNMVSGVGLLPVTYKGDYFTSWFSEEGINQLSDYVVRSGSTMLNLRKRNQDFLIHLMSLVSGNRWVDYLQYIFDTDLELKDHPILIGYDEIDFGAVDFFAQSNNTNALDAPTGQTANVLGGSASKARQYSHKVERISVKTKEPGAIMVCTSIVPNVVYFQGTPRFQFFDAVEDLWHPQYQKQGFQELFRGEYFNPFVTAHIDEMRGLAYLGPEQESTFAPLAEINETSVSWVPLGWEHMATFDTISGAMKTTAFSTWSNRRDYNNTGAYERTGTLERPSYTPFKFEPLFDDNIDRMKSTYVDSGLFNNSFANISRAECDNYIAKFSYHVQMYQPLTHTLISKTI